MKIGTKYQSEIKPDTGFNIRREGYSIYLQYIPEDSITTVFVPDKYIAEFIRPSILQRQHCPPQ